MTIDDVELLCALAGMLTGFVIIRYLLKRSNRMPTSDKHGWLLWVCTTTLFVAAVYVIYAFATYPFAMGVSPTDTYLTPVILFLFGSASPLILLAPSVVKRFMPEKGASLSVGVATPFLVAIIGIAGWMSASLSVAMAMETSLLTSAWLLAAYWKFARRGAILWVLGFVFLIPFSNMIFWVFTLRWKSGRVDCSVPSIPRA